MSIPECVLISDGREESRQAQSLLEHARVPFLVVTTDEPGREHRLAPQLYTKDGVLPHLHLINAWVSVHNWRRNGRNHHRV